MSNTDIRDFRFIYSAKGVTAMVRIDTDDVTINDTTIIAALITAQNSALQADRLITAIEQNTPPDWRTPAKTSRSNEPQMTGDHKR